MSALDNPVTIRNFQELIEAEIVRSRLTSEGIEAFLLNTHVASIRPFLIPATGGIALQVRKRDAEAAIAILEECEKAQSSETQNPRKKHRGRFLSWLLALIFGA